MPTALLPLLPLPPIHKPLLLRFQSIIHILRLEDMHPAIQPTGRHPPLFCQILSCPALLILFQRLPRFGFEFGQVLLQRRAAAQDLVWMRCLPARRLDVLWGFVGVGLVRLQDRGRQSGWECDVGVWQRHAVWEREEGRYSQRHLCQQRMWIWEQSMEENNYAICVQLTIVVHCEDFELYLTNGRLKCRVQDALLLVAC